MRSQEDAEPLWGTATSVAGYLLVEEPGPWGTGGVPESRLGPELTEGLRAVARRRGVKLLLVRRPGPERRARDEGRRVFLVDARRTRPAVLSRTCAQQDLVSAADADTGWERGPDLLHLVCTHGRKDWCCAVRGRPVAAALAALRPDAVWECSHLGGDRFAASVLTLPTGVLHGRVAPQDAAEVVEAAEAGRLVPRLLRGRTADAVVVQAADARARTAQGLDALDALVPVQVRREGPDASGPGTTWRVRFDQGGEPLVVVLSEGRADEQQLTCGAQSPARARTWDLVALERGALERDALERGPA